jgi:cytochrome c1
MSPPLSSDSDSSADCHSGSTATTGPSHQLDREGAWQGPDLSREGLRHDASWLRDWIADPSSVRFDATMPPFGDHLTEEELAAIAKYLANRK